MNLQQNQIGPSMKPKIVLATMKDRAEGWHSRGYLPHLDARLIVQFVTFRLADSLPAHATSARALDSDELVERKLDRSYGSCWLAQPEIASTVEEALLHFDGTRYRLLAWCIMPNHVHAVVELQAGGRLHAIVQSWKSFSAKRANQRLGRRGAFWYPDYFDRYMRDGQHLDITIDYVERNPVTAGLVENAAMWRWSSARRRAARTC